MKAIIIATASITMIACTTADSTPSKRQGGSVAQVFEHYEGARLALAADRLAEVDTHAKELVSSVQAVAGTAAKQAADGLAAATTIAEARKHFGELSVVLVPKFQESQIAGTFAFFCRMKNLPWVQRGEKVENPYYGRAMLDCGASLAP